MLVSKYFLKKKFYLELGSSLTQWKNPHGKHLTGDTADENNIPIVRISPQLSQDSKPTTRFVGMVIPRVSSNSSVENLHYATQIVAHKWLWVPGVDAENQTGTYRSLYKVSLAYLER